MITYNWTYKCDYCEKKIRCTTKFSYYYDQPVLLPNRIPDVLKHGRWRIVDDRLVCPKHSISILNRKDKDD